MSNNKQSIKLYTEEDIINAALYGRWGGTTEKDYIDFMNSLTPIELPSDEDIREERLLQFPDTEYTNRANDRLAFYCGAKFVINKIQGGNNNEQQ